MSKLDEAVAIFYKANQVLSLAKSELEALKKETIDEHDLYNKKRQISVVEKVESLYKDVEQLFEELEEYTDEPSLQDQIRIYKVPAEEQTDFVKFYNDRNAIFFESVLGCFEKEYKLNGQCRVFISPKNWDGWKSI